MKIRIKSLAFCGDLLDALFFQCIDETLEDQLHALPELGIAAFGLHGPLEVVQNGKNLRQCLAFCYDADFFLLPGGALAVVVKLRHLPEQLIGKLCVLLLQSLQLFRRFIRRFFFFRRIFGIRRFGRLFLPFLLDWIFVELFFFFFILCHLSDPSFHPHILLSSAVTPYPTGTPHKG